MIPKINVFAGGTHSGNTLKTTEIYNTENDTMTSGPDLDEGVYKHCGAVFKLTRQIYIVGGVGALGDDPGRTTQTFYLSNGSFSTLEEQMSVAKSSHICTILEEERVLVAAGGFTTGLSATNSVEILDLVSGTWSTASSMPSAGGNVLGIGEFLFMWDTKFYQYDQTRDDWFEIEDVPFDLNKLRPNFIQIDAGVTQVC